MTKMQRCLMAVLAALAVSSSTVSATAVDIPQSTWPAGSYSEGVSEYLTPGTWVREGSGEKIVVTDTELQTGAVERRVTVVQPPRRRNKFWRNVCVAGACTAAAVGFTRYLYPGGATDTTMQNFDRVVYPALGQAWEHTTKVARQVGDKIGEVTKPHTDKLFAEGTLAGKGYHGAGRGLNKVGEFFNSGVQAVAPVVSPHLNRAGEHVSQFMEDARAPTRQAVEQGASHVMGFLRRVPGLQQLGVQPQLQGVVPTPPTAGVAMPAPVGVDSLGPAPTMPAPTMPTPTITIPEVPAMPAAPGVDAPANAMPM